MKNYNLILLSIADSDDKTSIIKNRIRKNYRHIRKWAKRTNSDCFRIYDRDIKQYPLAIDYYAGRFCVQFFSYDRENDAPSIELKKEINEVLFSLFRVKKDQIFWRSRIRRTKDQQYEKRDYKKDFFTVYENGIKFKINLFDYLDTGLFLDHKETRRMIFEKAKGKKVLNLFAYTCSFSVYAALGGATFTKSVDMSNTYTQWGKENFILNGLSLHNNKIIRDDCMKFLDEEVQKQILYDIIIIDPPTISRSKKMDQMFDIQKDYFSLLQKAKKLLTPNGVIYFSTNSRKFSFDKSLFSSCVIEEITDKTIPLDFHNKKIHKCWKIFFKNIF